MTYGKVLEPLAFFAINFNQEAEAKSDGQTKHSLNLVLYGAANPPIQATARTQTSDMECFGPRPNLISISLRKLLNHGLCHFAEVRAILYAFC